MHDQGAVAEVGVGQGGQEADAQTDWQEWSVSITYSTPPELDLIILIFFSEGCRFKVETDNIKNNMYDRQAAYYLQYLVSMWTECTSRTVL